MAVRELGENEKVVQPTGKVRELQPDETVVAQDQQQALPTVSQFFSNIGQVAGELPGNVAEGVGSIVPTWEQLKKSATSRATFETAGGMVGTGVGMLGGNPATMLGGGALGTAIGNSLFNLKEAITGGEGAPQSSLKAITDPAEAAAFDLAFAGAGDIAFHIAGQLGKRIVGIGSKEAQEAIVAGARQGVPLDAFRSSTGKASRVMDMTTNITGVFPFAGGPLRKSQRRVSGQFVKALGKNLESIAPSATVNEIGLEMTEQAAKKFRKNKAVYDALYENFRAKVKELPRQDIFPASPVSSQAENIVADIQSRLPAIKGGKTTRPKNISAQVMRFINQNRNLADRQTIEALQGIKSEAGDLMARDSASNIEKRYLQQIKVAAEQSMNNPEFAGLPEAQARDVLSALETANNAFWKTMRQYETPTAQAFERVDKNIFSSGVSRPGKVNADEVLSKVWNTKSLQAIKDLRQMVGDDTYNKAVRNFLEEKTQGSIRRLGEAQNIQFQFDAEKFKRNLGLDSEQGRRALQEMLRESNVSVGAFKDLSKIADSIDGVFIPDPSQFVTRRLVLGGSLAGSGLIGGSTLGLPAAAAATLLVNRFNKVISSPSTVKMLQKATEESTSASAARQLISRAVEQVVKQQNREE